MMVNRTVVLPDFQGIGLGSRVRNVVACHYFNKGFRVIMTSSHPAVVASGKKDPLWKCTKSGRVNKNGRNSKIQNSKNTSRGRLTTSWEYKPT